MPHTGLIPPDMCPSDEALLRAKLHIRGGNLRLSKGEIADGFASFYDAVISAMLRFTLSPQLSDQLQYRMSDDLSDDRQLFSLLKRSEIFSSKISEKDFEYLHDVVYSAMDGNDETDQVERVRHIVETVLNELGVLPIFEGELPV